MANLSGYDSEAIGFQSISKEKRGGETSSTQTTEFSEVAMSSQTNLSVSCGTTTLLEESAVDANTEGLNEFLRKVVPIMLEQLGQVDQDPSDDEEVLSAKLLQVIQPDQDRGDDATSVLDLSLNNTGNSLAISIGRMQHEEWCTHDGVIKNYAMKGYEFVFSIDISENSCITALKYHPSVALLAYGTSSGEVSAGLGMKCQGHGAKRVSALLWADQHLANICLKMHISNSGKRRNASDQILISSGSDGSVNIWIVNVNLKMFDLVISYKISGDIDITCFDFIKKIPLRLSDERIADDIFVVGSKTGGLYLCKIKNKMADIVDPVYDVLEGHATCVLNVLFSEQRSGIFASLSIDSELRIYDINQRSPLKVICLDAPVSCMSWLPNQSVVVVGLAKPEEQCLKVINVWTGRPIPIEGLIGSEDSVTALEVQESGACRIAAGDSGGSVRIWELPTRRIRFTNDDFE